MIEMLLVLYGFGVLSFNWLLGGFGLTQWKHIVLTLLWPLLIGIICWKLCIIIKEGTSKVVRGYYERWKHVSSKP